MKNLREKEGEPGEGCHVTGMQLTALEVQFDLLTDKSQHFTPNVVIFLGPVYYTGVYY